MTLAPAPYGSYGTGGSKPWQGLEPGDWTIRGVLYPGYNGDDMYVPERVPNYGSAEPEPAPQPEPAPAEPSSEGHSAPSFEYDSTPTYPSWAMDYSQSAAGRGAGFYDAMEEAIRRVQGSSPYQGETRTMTGNMMSAYDNLAKAPEYIEQKRTAIPQEFLAGMMPMQEYFQPVIDQMAAAGRLNSAFTGQAMADVQNDINRQYGGQVAGANTWAAGANLDHLQAMPGIAQSITTALNNLDRFWLAKELGAGQLAQGGAGLANQAASMGAGMQATQANADWAQMGTLMNWLMG